MFTQGKYIKDSQDFQYSTPRIFNPPLPRFSILSVFFSLSIIMRNFAELSDILQNAATGVN